MEEPKKKSGRKAGDVLDTIGSFGSLLGPLLFGPEMGSQLDLGAPFKAIANRQRQTAQEQGLLDILGSTPEGAALMQGGQQLASQGGIGALFSSPSAISQLVDSGNMPLAGQLIQADAQKKPVSAADIEMQNLEKLFLEGKIDKIGAETTKIQEAPLPTTVAQDSEARAKAKAKFQDIPGTLGTKMDEIATEASTLDALEAQLDDPAFFKELTNTDMITKAIVSEASQSKWDLARGAGQMIGGNKLFSFNQNLHKLLSDYGKRISGAAISAQEFGRLKAAILASTDNPELLKSRLNDLRVFNRRHQLGIAAGSTNVNVHNKLGFSDQTITLPSGQTVGLVDAYKDYTKLRNQLAGARGAERDRLKARALKAERLLGIRFQTDLSKDAE